eukprot:gene1835-977_t
MDDSQEEKFENGFGTFDFDLDFIKPDDILLDSDFNNNDLFTPIIDESTTGTSSTSTTPEMNYLDFLNSQLEVFSMTSDNSTTAVPFKLYADFVSHFESHQKKNIKKIKKPKRYPKKWDNMSSKWNYKKQKK